MKKLIMLAAVGLFYLNAIAQEEASTSGAANSNWKNKYCAEMRNGKLTLLNEGKEVTTDVTLANGAMINVTDATVTRKDGTKMALTAGECINQDGVVVTKEQMKKDKTKTDNKVKTPEPDKSDKY